MKVLFVSDFDLSQNYGGAQVSSQAIIDAGKTVGHNIKLHTFDSDYTDFFCSYDLIISSNLEVISKKDPDKLNLICNHNNHIRLEHDSCFYLDKQVRKNLFLSTQKTFFLSDFHATFFKSLYGNIFNNIEIVPDPIDKEIFFAKEEEKIYDIVYCGFLHELKGLNNLIKFATDNPSRKIDIFGWGTINLESFFLNFENINFHGRVSHEETASIYRKSKAIFHNPIVNEPFCRMIAESILCGVREFHGDMARIGSYLDFKEKGLEQFSQECKNAQNIFWKKVL